MPTDNPVWPDAYAAGTKPVISCQVWERCLISWRYSGLMLRSASQPLQGWERYGVTAETEVPLKLVEESLSGLFIPPPLRGSVEDVSVLIHRPPQMLLLVYGEHHFIEMPLIT
jgi:hypothetical protein